MNAASSKLLSWSIAGLLGVALTLYVGWFVSRLQSLSGRVTHDMLKSKLEDVDQISSKSEDIVPYKQVEVAMIDLNWTGRPKVREVAPVKEPEPVVEVQKSVADLLGVMMISFDAEEPASSKCWIKYSPLAGVRAPSNGTGPPAWIKMAGESLDDPLGAIKIAAIRPTEVEFSFSDEGRAHETVGIQELSIFGIGRLNDESELVLPKTQFSIRRTPGAASVPKTVEISRGIYQIGYEDADYVGENYSQILSTDVRLGEHRDPRTGRNDGIQVFDVKQGSMAQSHGISSGDVIKSINGTPVTSKQEAITFVKNNKDVYQKWEVVVESKGQLKTLVYYSPQK